MQRTKVIIFPTQKIQGFISRELHFFIKNTQPMNNILLTIISFIKPRVFYAPVTFFTGENGTVKSTLLEALAHKYLTEK
jgi:AAA15 family ATPase/GTPase